MSFYKKFISVWNEIKKIPSFMGSPIAVDQLSNTTAFPFVLNFFKNFSADYRKSKRNSWDYLLSYHSFENLNKLLGDLDEIRLQKINYLIEKYNQHLLVYSEDKSNPWVVDDRDKKSIKLHKKNYLEIEKQLSHIIDERIKVVLADNSFPKEKIELERARLFQLSRLALLKDFSVESIEEENLSSEIIYLDWESAVTRFNSFLNEQIDYAAIKFKIKEIKKRQKQVIKDLRAHYSRATESIRIYSMVSIWERANKLLIKNKLFQFFSTMWTALSAHANLLSLLSFLFLFFSLSLYSFPIIFILIAVSIGIYLAISFIFFIKNDDPFSQLMIINQEKILEHMKLEVFNQEKNTLEFNLLRHCVDNVTKEAKLTQYVAIFLKLEKELAERNPSLLNLQKSSLYQYLIQVYPKTQFVASLIINLTVVLLCTYILTWAISGFLTILGAVALASIVASPLSVGVLILVIAGFFLVRQLMEFRAREEYYQRTILNLVNEKCEYKFKDSLGKLQIMPLEKWKKFESLQKDIRLLVLAIEPMLINKQLENSSMSLYLWAKKLINTNIYAAIEQNQSLVLPLSFFKKFKKFLNRLFTFLAGGFYGYDLVQQIGWKSNLGIKISWAVTLPLQIVFMLPFILVNALANCVTYHLHSRQCDRLKFAKNLDNKLENLEQTRKKLLYLTAFIKVSSESENFDSHDEVTEHSMSLVSNNLIASSTLSLNTSSFFKKNTIKSESDLNRGLATSEQLIRNSPRI